MTETADAAPPQPGEFEAVLRSVRPGASLLGMEPLNQGGNNRAYRLRTREGDFLGKQYFSHAGDRRDRMNTEFRFTRYANRVAPRGTPIPLASHAERRMAIYEFIDGRSFRPGDVGEAEVDQAADFFVALNRDRGSDEARALHDASEAAFSLDMHIAGIEARLARLTDIEPRDALDDEARRLVAALDTAWRAAAAGERGSVRPDGGDAPGDLTEEGRCLSPSDFGFHNALRRTDGQIVFFDFEYAGWDDPARMAADFFAQVAVPVPEPLFERFIARSFSPFPDAASVRERARRLRRLYRFKWCCIVLAVFQPASLARRVFATGGEVVELKRVQLDKAWRIFDSIKSGEDHGVH
jgi:hypothetical protein